MEGPPTSTPDRGSTLWALVLGVLLGLLGVGAGRFLGLAYGRGFQFDWYQRPPVHRIPSSEVVVTLAFFALAFLLLAFALAAILARMDARRHERTGRRRILRSDAVSASVHSYGLALKLILVLVPLVIAGSLVLIAGTGRSESVQAADNVPRLFMMAGAFTGFLGAFIAFRSIRRAYAHGRIRAEDTDNIWSRIAVLCGRRARATILILLVITVVFGAGLARLDTNVDVADVMPRGDPNTAAAHNLTEKFKSSFTLQVTFQLRVASADAYAADNQRLSQRTTTPNRLNISDEVYVRAMDELVTFVKGYVHEGQPSPFVSSVALSDFYRLINWTVAGGINAPDSSYALPPPDSRSNEQLYASVDKGVWTAIPGTADAVISPDYQQTAVLFVVGPKEKMGGKEIGEWALRIREAYLGWATNDPNAYHVFTGDNAPKFSVDLPLANAHSSELARKDFRTLLPVIAVWVVLCIFLAFRNWTSIGIAFAALVMGVTWTFGLMGYMNIPLNTLNLTVIPLIMGVGIDYGIHTLNSYQEARAQGLSTEATFRRLGSHGFLALFVATANTVVGLAVMIVSPSLLIAQLGILTSIAIISSFFITITFMPAALALIPGAKAREYRPSPLMAALARGVSRTRWVVVALLLVLTPLAGVFAQRYLTIEPFGDPPRNWLKDDPLRQEHEAAIQGFYNSPRDDVKANILIFEGNVEDPAAHRYMDAIEASLKKRGERARLADGDQGRVIVDTLRTLPFVVRTYLTVKDGVPGAGGFLGLQQLAQRNPGFQSADPYPRTEAEISALLKEMHTTPFANFANLFFDYPDNRMAMMLFSVRAATFEDAAEVWDQVMAPCDAQGKGCGAVAENEALRPKGLQVSFFGNTAINYLFVAKELPWVSYMSIVSNLLVVLFVYIPTRKIRPTLVVGLLNLLTGMWWLALLPIIGVGLAITLTLPLVFIFAIGSDYGLHLVLNILENRNTEETFRTTGKAILFSGITTFGAFVIYTFMSNEAVRRTMLATAVAIPIIFLITILTVPVLYPTHKWDGRPPKTKTQHAPPPLDDPAQTAAAPLKTSSTP